MNHVGSKERFACLARYVMERKPKYAGVCGVCARRVYAGGMGGGGG